jgi:hypothetical protein
MPWWLQVCNVGVNGANAVQTGWLVALLDGPHRALGLPLYNTGTPEPRPGLVPAPAGGGGGSGAWVLVGV